MWNEYINNNNESPDQSIINCDLTCIKYTYIYNGLGKYILQQNRTLENNIIYIIPIIFV